MSGDEPWRQAIARAEVLLAEGEAAEDISVIADAVSGFNAALKLAPRADVPLDWAKTQSRLSAALRALGARIDDPVMLHAAMTACDAALEVYSTRTAPQDWARTVALLGAAQVVLGERDSDPAWLHAAINSYRLATTVYTREAAPCCRCWVSVPGILRHCAMRSIITTPRSTNTCGRIRRWTWR